MQTHLAVKHQADGSIEIAIIAKDYSADGAGGMTIDEEVGSVYVGVSPSDVFVRVARIDESATGPVNVMVV